MKMSVVSILPSSLQVMVEKEKEKRMKSVKNVTKIESIEESSSISSEYFGN